MIARKKMINGDKNHIKMKKHFNDAFRKILIAENYTDNKKIMQLLLSAEEKLSEAYDVMID